jgi:hypothetical protein
VKPGQILGKEFVGKYNHDIYMSDQLALRAESSGKKGMLKLGGDWVPTWSGDLDDWETYKIRAGICVRGADQWKQSQRISNLVQVLEGKAWEAIENLSDNERDKIQESLVPFLAFLKEQCLPTAIPELGRRFREYLRFRRVRKESMRIYVKRYRLQLVKLENSMRAVDDGTTMLKKLQKAVRDHYKVLSAKRLLEETRKHKSQLPLKPKAKARHWKSAGKQPGTSSSAPQTWDWEDWDEEESMENEEEESDFEDDKSVNPSELSSDKNSKGRLKPKIQNGKTTHGLDGDQDGMMVGNKTIGRSRLDTLSKKPNPSYLSRSLPIPWRP